MTIGRLYNAKRIASSSIGTINPRSIANLAGWWDASAGGSLFQNSNGTTAASANNDPVGYWGDQSGNGRNITQSTANNRPLLVTNGLNGRPVISFDGVNDTLGASFTLAQPCHFFCVHKSNSAYVSGNPRIFSGWDQSADLLRNDAGSLRYFYGNAYSDANTLLFRVSDADNQTFIIFECQVDGASSVALRSGVVVDSVKNVGTNAPNGLRIAARFTGSDSFGSISVAEFLIYGRVLGASEASLVRKYLSQKYNLIAA